MGEEQETAQTESLLKLSLPPRMEKALRWVVHPLVWVVFFAWAIKKESESHKLRFISSILGVVLVTTFTASPSVLLAGWAMAAKNRRNRWLCGGAALICLAMALFMWSRVLRR